MVDQVLVPERNTKDALAQQVGNRVADGVGNAQIGEAGSQTTAEPDGPVRGCKQHDTAVGRVGAAVESAHKFAATGPSQVDALHVRR